MTQMTQINCAILFFVQKLIENEENNLHFYCSRTCDDKRKGTVRQELDV